MRKIVFLCSLLALHCSALTFTGCMVGPDFRKPETKIPAKWHGLDPVAATGDSALTSQPLDLVEWWKKFDDPLLTSLIERAIRSNLDLRQAASRVRQARAAVGVTSAGLFPEVNADAQYQRSRTPVTTATGTSGVERDFFRTGFDASWELDFFGRTRRGIEASQADLEAAIEDRRDVFITLVTDVGTNYSNLRQFQKQIEIARRNLEAQAHTAEITHKRYEAGFVGRLDLANARAQVVTTASRIPVLETSARTAIYSLSVLLGMEPAALQEELSSEKSIPPTPPQIPIGLPSDLLRRRPDIRRAEAQIHAATARIGVATADLFPRFSLTGSFSFSGSDVANFMNWGNRSWSFGPSVTWPVFEAGRIRWNIEIQNAVQEQTLLTYEQIILTALRDVETALISHTNELEHFKFLQEAFENNRKAVEVSMKLYVEGRTDFLNVLNAQRSLLISEEAMAQSTNRLTTNLLALYKALGGGWEVMEGGEPAIPATDLRIFTPVPVK